jgi:WD40 repeat protein/serine/threonine protein kinase
MPDPYALDEGLVQRLPLPLAQLCLRAHNAHTPLERHQGAYYLWEAALKLLACVAVAEYAGLGDHDPDLADRLGNLERPSLGRWWELVRRLVPVLADAGDPGFAAVRELLLGRARDDMPRAAGLDAALGKALDGRGGARTTVRLTELFDRLVVYRDREIGHGAAGLRADEVYAQMSSALLTGVTQVLSRLDVLAGRRLLYVGGVRRQGSGNWLVERYALSGESPRRVESLELAEAAATSVPRPQRVYLEAPPRAGGPPASRLRALHPLVCFEATSGHFYFLSGRGKRDLEYLCYASGDTRHQEPATELDELLGRVPGQSPEAEPAAARAAGGVLEPPAADPPPETAARRVGEFELLSRLGQGGMGVVYRAWQPSLGRQVALKSMLRAGEPKAEARFAREIRALGRVEHPNVVKVFTSGAEGDQWFYAMELIEGAELSRVCDQLAGSSATEVDGRRWQQAVTRACEEARSREAPMSETATSSSRMAPPPFAGAGVVPAAPPSTSRPVPALSGHDHVRRVVEIVRQVAGAAHALHEAGVVHRDIKPGNIMLTADGGHPVLMDLGLAQLADEADGRLTRTRQFLGTLRYASPEQVLAAGQVDRRTDVYSLGVTLWELLTLRPAYGAECDASPAELMVKIQTTDLESPRKYNRHLTRDMEAVVGKCLEKDLRRRYPTAAALGEDLRRFLAGEPVGARPVGSAARWWRWCRRNPAPAAAAGLGLLAFLAVIVLLVGYLFAREQSRAAEALRREKEQTERALAEAEHQRAEADRLRALADRYRGQAERLSATLLFKNAVALCEAGEAGRGLLAMARSLETAPDSSPDLQRAIRAGMAAEVSTLHTLEAILTHPSALPVAAFSPDGRSLLLAGQNAQLFDVATRSHRGPPQKSDSSVAAGAFSPDGKLFMTATFGGVIRIADADTAEDVGTPILHNGHVKAAIFRPDGKVLLVGAVDGVRLQCYGVDSREPVGPAFACGSEIYAAAYSPDGSLVVAGGMEGSGTARLWDARTGAAIGEPLPHPGPVFALAFSPDGRAFASGCLDGGIRFFDTQTGRPLGPTLRHHGPVRGVAFSRDGRLVSSCSEDGTARLWEVATGRPVGQVLTHPSEIRRAEFSPDGKHLLTGGFDGTARLWRMAPDRPAAKVLAHPGVVSAVTFSPDGVTALTGCRASEDKPGLAQLWVAATGRPRGRPVPHQGEVLTAAFSPDGRLAVSGGNDKTARLWRVADGSLVHPPWAYGKFVATAVFSPDGKSVALGGQGGAIQLRDVASGRQIASWKAHAPNTVWRLTFSPDGNTLLSAGSRAALLWRLPDGKPVGQPMQHRAEVRFATFSPDGKTVLTCGNDKTACLWSAADGHPLTPPLVHRGEIRAGAFHPDGRSVATAGADGTVRLWETATGKSLAPPLLHDGWVRAVAFSPDGKTLATGCDDGAVRLWAADGSAPLGAVLRHKGPVNEIAFSPDGKTVLTGSADGTARLWRPPLPVRGDPQRITLWIQILTGMELDRDGIVQVLDAGTWHARRRQLDELGGPPLSSP